MSDPDPLSIAIYSDVICPWCYVGKRRLEAALAAPGMPPAPRFVWLPFELNPDMPAEGVERQAYRATKFGAERSAELDANMLETGRELGIAFAFDRMARTPNTRLAHRLIWEAGRQGRQDAMVERLFHAYFEEARDIGEPHALQSLAAEVGLEPAAVRSTLSEAQSLEAVVHLEEQGYRMGIKGVPFFILAQKYGVSGAQPPEFWREALPRVAAEGEGAPAEAEA